MNLNIGIGGAKLEYSPAFLQIICHGNISFRIICGLFDVNLQIIWSQFTRILQLELISSQFIWYLQFIYGQFTPNLPFTAILHAIFGTPIL